VGGRRLANKIIVYSEVTGAWRELSLPPAMSEWTGFGHWYGQIAQDDDGNIYLDNHIYRPDEDLWSQMSPHMATSGGGQSLAWLPDALNGRGAILRYGGDAQRFQLYDPRTDSWPVCVDKVGNDLHALVRYHTTHKLVLVVGGSKTQQVANLVDLNGAARRVSDCPGVPRMSSGSWVVQHEAGCWIVKVMEPSPWLYAYWPTQDRWQELGPAPDATLKYSTAARYRDDILLIASMQGLHAMRLPAV
jgi:hypothetical protein